MILFIDDVYLKENYPIPFTVDSTRLRAIVKMSQRTLMRDMLGDPLYDAFEKYIELNEPNALFEYIEDDVKMLLCLYTAKGLYTSYYSGGAEAKDASVSYIDGNIKLYEQVIARKINSNEELLEITNASSANQANTDSDSYNSIFYPNSEEQSFSPSGALETPLATSVKELLARVEAIEEEYSLLLNKTVFTTKR